MGRAPAVDDEPALKQTVPAPTKGGNGVGMHDPALSSKLSKILVAAAVLIAATAGGRDTASAEVNYPWCVITSGLSEGVMSCGFVSYAQCMETRTGTEMCVQNPRYQAPPPPPVRPRQRQG